MEKTEPNENVARQARLLVILLLVAVPLGGCLEGSGSRDGHIPQLYVGGVHMRWIDDETIEVEGHLLNYREHVAELSEGFHPRVRIDGEHYFVPTSWEFPPQEEWLPGEARQFSAMFTSVKGDAFKVVVRVHEKMGTDSRYEGDCVDRSGNPAEGCPPGPAPTYTPASDAEWRDRLMACCGWLPPPFNAYDLACARQLATAGCQATIWNHADEAYDPTGEFVLYALPLDSDGERREVARQSVDVGGELAADESRTVSVQFDKPLLGGDTARSYEIEFHVARADVPKSLATDKTRLDLGVPPDG